MTKKKTKTTEKSQDYYKAPCPAIDQILRIKRLSPREAVDLYQKLKGYVKDLPQESAITTYALYLIKELVIDSDLLKPYLDDDTFLVLLKEIYDCITDIYIFFRIDYICGDINNKLRGSKPAVDPIDEILSQLEIDPSTSAPALARQVKKAGYPRTLKELTVMQDNLKKKIIGQDEAIESLIKRSKLISVGFEKRGAFFFIGRTGVGKTELAKQFGANFYGNFAKINCAEFSNGHEVSKLIGAPPGYIGSNVKSFFAEKAEKSNKWVFLFDEIEKAHEKLYNILLSLLDDGTITDSQGVTLDFSRSIFLFTSNQGISELKDKNLSFAKLQENQDANRETLKNSLDRQFTPEFRNRIDEFIYFNDLTRDQARKIAKLNLREYPVVPTDELLDYIVDNSFSVEYGVRELKRFVKNNVALLLAEEILNKGLTVNKATKFVIHVQDNKLIIFDVIQDIAS